MTVNSTAGDYSPSTFVEYGYMGTQYSYLVSQRLIHTYLPYLGEGGYVDVSELDSIDSSDTFSFSTEYGLAVACIPGCLLVLGMLSMICLCLTSCCQRRKRCCGCCQCYPKKKKKWSLCGSKQIGPVGRSKELALLFGEDDPRTLAAESRENAQDEKNAIDIQRKRVKRYLMCAGVLTFLFLLPTLYANMLLDNAVTEMQDITSEVKTKLETIGTHANSWTTTMNPIEEYAALAITEMQCNSTRLETIGPRISEISSQQSFLYDVMLELGTMADVVIERVNSDAAGTGRQLLLIFLFLWPLLVVYFMFFNIYKTEGAHCLGGLCIDGADGVNQTAGMGMLAFYLMLLVMAPFLTFSLAMADLCHSNPLDVLNGQVTGNLSIVNDAGSLHLSVPNVTAYYASCQGTNPLASFVESARNSSDELQSTLSRLSRYNATSYWEPPSCTDNSCVSCPTTWRVQRMVNDSQYLAVKINKTVDALACAEFQPLYSSLVEDTLCGDVYEGAAALGISQCLASLFLFLGMWLLLLLRQHYTWLDDKREDADYDSDHEGFEKWNMKGHDDSSSDGEVDSHHKKKGATEGDEGEGEDGDEDMDPVLGLLAKKPLDEETKEPEAPLGNEEDADNDSVGGYSRKSLDDLDSMMTSELRLRPGDTGSIFDDDEAYFNPNARPKTTGSVTASRRQAVQINLAVGGIHGTGKSILDYDAESLESAMMIKPRTVEEIVHFEAENPVGWESED